MEDLAELVNTMEWDKFGYKNTFKFIQLKPNYFKMFVHDERNPENNRYLVYKYESLCNNKSFLEALGKLKENSNTETIRRDLLDYLYNFGEKGNLWGLQNIIKEWVEENRQELEEEVPPPPPPKKRIKKPLE